MLTRIYRFLDPARIPHELPGRLQSLAQDCATLEYDVAFVLARLRTAPFLDLYSPVVTPLGLKLVGEVTQHPSLGSRRIITSQVWFADPDGCWARTVSRFYRLGRPADRIDIMRSPPLAFDGLSDSSWPVDDE
ncbi:hypothetical protein ONR75_18185 [Rhodopseudomonas sp. P2A-2r]|uniref:DUF6634 family protein n=1 Tax=Rhodopseudomonas sp. P2A-2r TaxID=2991972 RepID=UPI002234CA08|nr:DUF6634 family protein [Rhodopseudomonas sp. P2A-2r]UZE46943.1 hypothetical protein ONR75_18185 [Rhodopseudomonas sp. P2A-2r]